MQKVAGVEPAHNISGGVSEAVVESVVHAVVAVTYPPGDMLFIFANDIDSSIRGAAVHHDIFKVRIPLVNDGADGLFNKADSVVYRGNQRDARPLRGRGRRDSSQVKCTGYRTNSPRLIISGLHLFIRLWSIPPRSVLRIGLTLGGHAPWT
jgi:hypothetical protein